MRPILRGGEPVAVAGIAPLQSRRPLTRDGAVQADPPSPIVSTPPQEVDVAQAVGRGPYSSARPVARVVRAAVPVPTAPTSSSAGAVIVTGGAATARSLRPSLRPRRVTQAAAKVVTLRAKGAICGTSAIQGDVIAPVTGKLRGCGVPNAVRVRSVQGVALSTPAVMDCTTAKALNTWVARAVLPEFGAKGGGVRRLRVAAGYACRTRNSQPGAKISEHGKGRAIDISGIDLRDGTRVTLLGDWGKGSNGRILRRLWQAACGPFGTVLGPESNRFHRDHFHFDTARYRSGPYCR